MYVAAFVQDDAAAEAREGGSSGSDSDDGTGFLADTAVRPRDETIA